jgi:hypothetical protein
MKLRQSESAAEVRFGSEADIPLGPSDIRFAPNYLRGGARKPPNCSSMACATASVNTSPLRGPII